MFTGVSLMYVSSVELLDQTISESLGEHLTHATKNGARNNTTAVQ